MSVEEKKPGETAKEMSLRLSVVQKTLELMSSAFVLVAALAWNDAVQSLFLKLFGPTNGVIAKFMYAVAITILVLVIALRVARVSKTIETRYSNKDS